MRDIMGPRYMGRVCRVCASELDRYTYYEVSIIISVGVVGGKSTRRKIFYVFWMEYVRHPVRI